MGEGNFLGGAFFLGFLEPGILHEDNYFHFKPT